MEPGKQLTTPPAARTTIVAIGASAGGLEALQGFFGAAPPDPRLAYVVLTHLAPQHQSHMAELLARASALPVAEARDGERIVAGRVYVIPPGCLMGIRAGELRLEQAMARPAIPRPIDHFMCELAEDQQERCAGIVLSGADHDGTVGLKEIKAAGGLTLVQDPATAKFPSMPQSAIAARVPDRVLPVQQMGQALVDYLDCAPSELDAVPEAPGLPAPEPGAEMPVRLREVLALVRERTGHDFRWYRPAMLLRRLRRRMGLNATSDPASYLALLGESREEVDALLKDFLISVTEFFRDTGAWQAREELVIPGLLARAGETGVRVWTPGCATGEESYSVAMLLQEQMGAVAAPPPMAVFATDIDTSALATARAGAYPSSISVSVTPVRLARFFEKVGERYVVRKSLREAVLFASQNLVLDPPFSKCDLIICRNVLIYFEPVLQSRILDLFHFALNPGGILFLGKSESLGTQSSLFEPVSREHRIFRRVGTGPSTGRMFLGRWSGPGGFLTPTARAPAAPGPAEFTRAHLAGAAGASGAAVLVNRDGRALYFHGETGRYLQPSGEPAWDLASLVREGCRVPLRAGLHQAIRDARLQTLDVVMKRDDNFVRVVVRIEPLEDFERSGLLLVSFDEAPGGATDAPGKPMPKAQGLPAPEEELVHTRSQLLAAEREAERATAELRVANEEAMSMNEELQSSNEELETSKEELQALVEELSTVNSELEAKLAELERTLNDLRNLMDSTRVATLFLDRELRIRRFTPEAAHLFHVMDRDVGRPLQDIASRVADPDLLSEARTVLERLLPAESEVRTADNEWFLRRILPYRTRAEQVEGVIVSYTDITRLHAAAQQTYRLAAVLHDSNDAVIAHDLDGRIVLWNHGAQRTYGYDEEEARRMGLARLVPEAERPAMDALAAQARKEGSAGPANSRRRARDGRLLDVSVTASALRDDAGAASGVLWTERDVTAELGAQAEARFRAMADDIPALLQIDDGSGQAQFLNRAWTGFTGVPVEGLLGQGWLAYVHPEDKADYVNDARQAFQRQRHFERDLRLRRADGSYRWIREIAAPRRDDDGRLVNYVRLALDVEERKRAEQALAEASERKDEFLAMLAHELRNPLAPIRNAANVIARSGPSEPRIAWAMGVIERQTQQLSGLVEDLMDVARVTSGKILLHPGPVELSVLLERACDSVRPMLEARRQRLTVALPPDPLFVEADLLRLTQVIGNLLNNASKYSAEEDEIRLAVSATPAEVEITVQDQGVGIAPDMLPRVFDLFAQADKTLDRAQGGLGIGLTLVKRLVEMLGGTVEAHSEGLGWGSRFVVRLPRLHVPRPAEQATPPAEAATNDGALRVLVVDDNADSAESAAVLLRMEGHDVRVAQEGKAALSLAAQFRPQVVVLDIGLPGISGYEVARQLRGRRETADALLIALTGYGRPADMQRAKEAGVDHHLVKAGSPDQLLALVRQRLPGPTADG